MPKVFNVTAVCIPEEHYMVNIDKRLKEIKALVDKGKYFTVRGMVFIKPLCRTGASL